MRDYFGDLQQRSVFVDELRRAFEDLPPKVSKAQLAYNLRIGVMYHPQEIKSLLTEMACLEPEFAWRLRWEIPEDLSENEKALTEESACKKANSSFWLRHLVVGLSKERKLQAEEKACSNSECAFDLRKSVLGLFEQTREMAIKAICSDIRTAFKARREIGDLPEEEKQLLEERLCQNPQWAFCLRLGIPDLSEETKVLAEKATQREWRGTQEVLSAINAILPRWVLQPLNLDIYVPSGITDEIYQRARINRARDGIPLFYRIDQVPVFANGPTSWLGVNKWHLIDSGKLGTLISNFEYPEYKVVLLPDVSVQEKGYAVRVHPELKTVHEARAWMYQEPAEDFEGFTLEV